MRAAGVVSKAPPRHAEPGSASSNSVQVLDPLMAFVVTSSGMSFVAGIV